MAPLAHDLRSPDHVERAMGPLIRSRLAVAALAVAVVVSGTAYNGDDDDGEGTTTVAPTTPPTVATTAAVATTAPPTDPPTTPAPTVPATTVPDVDTIKTQIAADYVRSAQLRDEWTRNPTLENLDQRAATISAPGSPDYEGLVALIRELVEQGERLVPGEPDLNAVTVETGRLHRTPRPWRPCRVHRVQRPRVGPRKTVSYRILYTAPRSASRSLTRSTAGCRPGIRAARWAEGVTTCPTPTSAACADCWRFTLSASAPLRTAARQT